MGDDAVGILVARALKDQVGPEVAVIESSLHGLALLDLLVGYQRAVIIDALQSGQHPPGSILELNPTDFRPIKTPSPHYAGLPEMLAMARQYQWQFPEEIRIFAVEVEDALTIREELSPSIQNAIPELVKRVKAQVDAWCD